MGKIAARQQGSVESNDVSREDFPRLRKQKLLLTAAELQSEYGLKVGTVRAWKSKRKIWPRMKMGRTNYFWTPDVLELIECDPHYDAWARERLQAEKSWSF